MKRLNNHIFSIILLTGLLSVGLVTPVAKALPLIGFPDADATSGQFITVTRGLSSLGDIGTGQNPINLSIAVPASLTEFKLHIFDGDIGVGDIGVGSFWDRTPDGVADGITFKLFRDPDLINNTDPADQLHFWPAAIMPDNGWCELSRPVAPLESPDDPGVCADDGTLPRDDDACPNFPLGNCYYHLVADWVTTTVANEQNSFKVAVEGQPFLRAGSTIGFEVFGCNTIGFPITIGETTYNDCVSLINTLAPNPRISVVTYDGLLSFDFLVEEPSVQLTLFDGDADLSGSSPDSGTDTDDTNSPLCDPFAGGGAPTRNRDCTTLVPDTAPFEDTICEVTPGDCIVIPSVNGSAGVVLYPPFQVSPLTVAEGVNPGAPLDDQDIAPLRVSPPVQYKVTAPGGLWTRSNENPSGDSEWEQFIIRLASTPPDFPAGVEAADVTTVPEIPAGLYNWEFEGLDFQNTLFVHSLYALYPSGGECKLAITKTCQTPNDPIPSSNCVARRGDRVDYTYTVTNTSTDAVQVSVTDNQLGVIVVDQSIPSGQSKIFTASLSAVLADTQNIATVTGFVGEKQCIANAAATVRVRQGGEGCTPGYWKQSQHFDSWNVYTPTNKYRTVFGVGYGPSPNPNTTLLQALQAGGGGYQALGRHSVAALLNAAANSGVDYLFTVDDVIARVRYAYAFGEYERVKNLFAAQNEQGCPLN